MPWIVYDTDRLVVGIFKTQAEADALADTSIHYTAHDSEVTGTDYDDDAETKGGWFFTTDGAVSQAAVLTDVEQLKVAITNTQAAFRNWLRNLQDQSVAHDPDDFKKGHQYLWRGLQGLYIVVNDSTSYTLARRIRFATELAYGSLDIPTVSEFYRKIADISAAPTAPTVWVVLPSATNASLYDDESKVVRVNLNAAVPTGGTEPASSIDLLAMDWVDSITA